MIYLSGAINERLLNSGRTDIGLILSYRPKGGMAGKGDVRRAMKQRLWAADNGCFTNPNLNVEDYYTWLTSLKPYAETCLFATAPDVVGDSIATWERSESVLPRLRSLGYAAALVAQDGIENRSIRWSAFDCLFIGGSTEWKLSAEILPLVREALKHGKWVHMGRVNTFRRLIRARFYGCHSTDGTQLKFGPDKNLSRLIKWLDFLKNQPPLCGVHDD
jgi:hypothetical protein